MALCDYGEVMHNYAFFAQIITIFLLLKGIGEDGKQGLRVENMAIFFFVA